MNAPPAPRPDAAGVVCFQEPGEGVHGGIIRVFGVKMARPEQRIPGQCSYMKNEDKRPPFSRAVYDTTHGFILFPEIDKAVNIPPTQDFYPVLAQLSSLFEYFGLHHNLGDVVASLAPAAHKMPGYPLMLPAMQPPAPFAPPRRPGAPHPGGPHGFMHPGGPHYGRPGSGTGSPSSRSPRKGPQQQQQPRRAPDQFNMLPFGMPEYAGAGGPPPGYLPPGMPPLEAPADFGNPPPGIGAPNLLHSFLGAPELVEPAAYPPPPPPPQAEPERRPAAPAAEEPKKGFKFSFGLGPAAAAAAPADDGVPQPPSPPPMDFGDDAAKGDAGLMIIPEDADLMMIIPEEAALLMLVETRPRQNYVR